MQNSILRLFIILSFCFTLNSCGNESNPDPVEPDDSIPSQGAFITTWQIEESDKTLSIPTHPDRTDYSYSVDWGDGNVSRDQTGEASHTYESGGLYTVKIIGDFPHFYMNDRAELKNRLGSIEQWGEIEWRNFHKSFAGCEGLEYKATDAPDLSKAENFAYTFSAAIRFDGDLSSWDMSRARNCEGMFQDARLFNGNIKNWNMENVTNISKMFAGAFKFNQPIGNWNTSKVTDMNNAFMEATGFNQSLNDWNVSSVTNMQAMFFGAVSFNQDLNQWDISAVTRTDQMFWGAAAFNGNISNWNTSQVTRMDRMFMGATAFNQDIRSWNVGNVERFESTFLQASSFDWSLESWDIGKATDMVDMLDLSGMSVNNYNNTLYGWSQLNNIPQGINLGADGLKYCPFGNGGAAKKILEGTYDWTIIGDSEASPDDCRA